MTMPRQAFFPVEQPEAVVLAAMDSAVPLARRLVTEVVRHWHLPAELTHDAELVTSELTTNALNATRAFNEARGLTEVGRIKLRLRWHLPSLFIEVWDINPVLPVRKDADEFETSGRGLGIVEFICENWAAFHCEEGGKLVWTEQRLSSCSRSC